MHIGRGAKAPKTKYVFFPPPGFFTRKQIMLAQVLGEGEIVVRNVTPRKNHESKCRREEEEYIKLEETRLIVVSDGFVTFCCHFKYLGIWISFSLRDDHDIERRIAAASAAMGALRKCWLDEHVDIYSKYMIFRAIPYNLLLWGCKSWALRQNLLNTLEVFLHRSIWSILGIKMSQVRVSHTKNDAVRVIFYNIPCIPNQIAHWQLTFIGGVLRREGFHIPTRLLTS